MRIVCRGGDGLSISRQRTCAFLIVDEKGPFARMSFILEDSRRSYQSMRPAYTASGCGASQEWENDSNQAYGDDGHGQFSGTDEECRVRLCEPTRLLPVLHTPRLFLNASAQSGKCSAG